MAGLYPGTSLAASPRSLSVPDLRTQTEDACERERGQDDVDNGVKWLKADRTARTRRTTPEKYESKALRLSVCVCMCEEVSSRSRSRSETK